MELVQSRGNTAPFISIGHGAVSFQLSRMLQETLAAPVTQAVRRAIEQDLPIRVDGLQVHDDHQEYHIAVEVLPIHSMSPRSRCFLVLFTPSSHLPKPTLSKEIPESGKETPDPELVERLRQELASTKLYLQTLLEERDANNQELLSANEEIQSANEEMQSTNEELQTTKEELQSSNEELQTVNDELQQRNSVLTQTSNDLSNLLNSVNLPVLMLSNELHIRHFTPPTQRLMNLRPPDIGRPFSEIRPNLNIQDLQPLFLEVVDTLSPREMEVQDKDGRWYVLRVRPYRTTENKIDGVVIVLLDVDQLRRSQQELRAARDFAQSVIENVRLPLAVVDLDLRFHAANDAFRTFAGMGERDLERRFLPELAAVAWGLEEPLRSRLEELRVSRDAHNNFEFEFTTPGEKPRVLVFRGTVLPPDGDRFLLITVQDITAHTEVERERLASKVESIRLLVEDFQEREKMIASFGSQNVPEGLPSTIAIGLYRITQEALRNVSKHAGRTHVRVNLKGSNGSIRLQVIDSGHGFEVSSRRSGLGLISMEERARMMQGTFTVESEPGEGTRITVDVPWPQPAEVERGANVQAGHHRNRRLGRRCGSGAEPGNATSGKICPPHCLW